jgi:hypothetical protein
METKDYKKEILATRTGCVGSSDGRMLAQIANSGVIPTTYKERCAVIKGLKEPKDNVVTKAMQTGDLIEQKIYEILKKSYGDAIKSNPLWESIKYVRRNVRLITHPDFVVEDFANKHLHVYEVKTTKDSWKETRDKYKAQLYIHRLITIEQVLKYGSGWRYTIHLVVYNTQGLDLESMTLDDIVAEFDPERIENKPIKFATNLFDMNYALDVLDDYLDNLTEWYDEEDVDANLLPHTIKERFDKVADALMEIKAKEVMIDEFKEKLYKFMLDKNIKSIKNDVFAISRVDPTESHSFDSRRYLEYFAEKHPRKYIKLVREYDKCTKRKGYVNIKIKSNKKS